MADAVTLQGRLDAAEEAFDKLSTGQSEATVKYEGFEVQYNRTSIAHLHRYIRGLKKELGQSVKSGSRGVTF